MLRPTCVDLNAVRDAGDRSIVATLELIARLCFGEARRLVDRDAQSYWDRDKVVVLYGGMVHNDLAPSEDRASFSYAPALAVAVGGRFVEVDLVVPEYIRDDETWRRRLPCLAHYDRTRLGARTTLFRPGERRFVMVFAQTVPAASGDD
jgi:hypothetical protein